MIQHAMMTISRSKTPLLHSLVAILLLFISPTATTRMFAVEDQAPPFQSRHVQVGNFNVHYWKEGPKEENDNDDNAAAEPLILLHGIACSVREFEHNIATLSQTHRVYAVDILGHGKTDKPLEEEYYTVDFSSQFVLDFMNALDIERAHILGWSMGGRIALETVANHPDRFKSLTLLAPAGIDNDRQKFGGGVLHLLRLIASVPFVGTLKKLDPTYIVTRRILKKLFYTNPSSYVTEEWVARFHRTNQQPGANEAMVSILQSALNVYGYKPEIIQDTHAKLDLIQNHTVPVLVVWGKQDEFLSSQHHKVLLDKLDNVRVELIDDCGHAPHIEKKDEVETYIQQFLREVSDV